MSLGLLLKQSRCLWSVAIDRHVGFVAAVAVLSLLTWLGPLAARGAAGDKLPDNASVAEALRFRRLYVPAEQTQQWPHDNAKYLPITTGEFERLLATASGGSKPQASGEARVLIAEYQARWIGKQCLTGKAVLQVKHLAQSPTWMPLVPCGLAIAKAAWTGTEAAKATLGLTDDDKLELLVERSGMLEFDWSLEGRRDTPEATTFLFELPASPVNRLSLDLPENMGMTSDRGLVEQSGVADPGMRRWCIELGGHRRCHVHVAPADAPQQQRFELALVRESLTYDVSLHGVEVSAQWKFEVHNEPLTQVAVTLDPGLQLVSVRSGDAAVPWSSTNAASGKSGRDGKKAIAKESRVVLTLPEPIKESGRTLRLWAIAPLVTERPFRLPKMRAEQVFWQEGNATLAVLAPLVLKKLTPIKGRQSGTGSLPAPRVGESAQFQFFAPQATIEIAVGTQEPSVQILSGTAVDLGRNDVKVRVVADFQTTESPKFTLEADVLPRWLIESADSAPANAIDDWSVAERNGRSRLTLRLAKALTPERPLRLTIHARRAGSPVGRKWGLEELLPLRFHDLADSRRLVSLRTTDPYQLKITGLEQVKRPDPLNLSPSERALFGESPQPWLFEDGPGAARLRVAVESQKTGYSGTIQVEAIVDNGTLQENYLLHCVPAASWMDNVLVHFSQHRTTPLHWALESDGKQPLDARLVPAEAPHAPGSKTEQETWEVKLPRTRNTPFDLRAVRNSRLANGQTVSLASLVDTDSQRGTLVVRSRDANSVQVKNRRLEPLPAATEADQRDPTLRAVYRYDPVRETAAGSSTGVTLRTSDIAVPPLAWVWNCHLQSRYQTDGNARHVVCYRLQNCGSPRMLLTLPPPVAVPAVRGIWVDGSQVAWHCPNRDQDRVLTIELPLEEKFPTVAVDFTTAAGSLGLMGSLRPPLPETDLPVLSRCWTVWLPPGYGGYGLDRCWQPLALPSSNAAERLFSPLARTTHAGIFDPLAEQLTQAATPADANLVPVETGQSKAGEPLAPWRSATVESPQSPDTPGWTAYHAEMSAGSPVTLKFVDHARVRLLGFVVFLLVVSGGWWQARRGLRPLVLALSVFGSAALLLAEPFYFIASGAVLGVLFCLAMRWIARPLSPTLPVVSSAEYCDGNNGDSMASRILLLLGATGVLLLSGGALLGQERTKSPAASPSPVYRVLIPVDDVQQPVGNKCYLPEQLYKQLYLRAATANDKPQRWLIGAATYRGTLLRETAPDRLVLDELRANFALDVFGRMTHVRIPLRREGANLLPDGATLDGRPIQPDWEPDGGALAFDVPEPGQYSLELTLRPTLRNTATHTAFELGIPRLATSRFELDLPSGAPVVEVPSATGMVWHEDAAQRLVAQLGATDRLSVHWPTGTGSGSMGATTDVEQLLWLKVQPGSVVLEARLKLKILEGQVRQLQLSADPGLRLLPLKGADAPAVEVRSMPGQPQTILLQWPHAVSDRAIVDLAFLLTEISGVGNLRPPQLEVLDARTTRHWLAVSVDRALEVVDAAREHESPSAGAESLAIPSFLSAWGKFDAAPMLAVELKSPEIAWSVSTRPRQPHTTTTQNLVLGAAEDHTTLLFDAHLMTTAGYNFQLRVRAPAELDIDRLSLIEGGIERVGRWLQDRTGTITVFLTGAVAGPQVFSLHGRLPTILRRQAPAIKPPAAEQPMGATASAAPAAQSPSRAQSGTALPLVQIVECEVLSSTVQMYRQPAVQVAVRDASGLLKLEDAAGEPGKAELGRLVGCFRVESDKARAELVVSPNQPKIQAEQVTQLWHDGKSWQAEVDCRLRLTGGVIDELRLDVPASFAGPYQATPAETLRVVDVAGENRQLVLQPRQEIAADYRFRISSTLSGFSGDRITAPDVVLRQVNQSKRYLILPEQLQQQRFAWYTWGMKPGELPTGFAAPADGGRVSIYELIGKQARASLRPGEQTRNVARVRLSDISLAWQADGSCRGVAIFDVEPSRSSECPLWLPHGYRLVHVAVDGLPASLTPAGTNVWQVPLGPSRSPQRVDVVFDGTLRDAGESHEQRVDAPSLGSLPVAASLWAVAGPAGFEITSCGVGEPVAPWQFQMMRLRNVAALAQSAAAASEDKRESLDAYRYWARQFADARRAFEREWVRAGRVQATREEEEALLAIDREQAQLAARIGADKVLEPLPAEASPTVRDAQRLWQSSLGHSQAVVRYTFSEGVNSLTLVCRAEDNDSLLHRLPSAFGFAALVLLGAFAMRRKPLAALLAEWPQAIGALVGLAWWLWLWPSWLGPVILLACLFTAVRAAWKRFAERRTETVSKRGLAPSQT